MDIIITLIENVALLLILVFLEEEIFRRWPRTSRRSQVFSGVLFGLVTIAVMAAPIEIEKGYIFDARAVPLVVSGLFGGPVVSAVAAAIAAIYRWSVGGVGAPLGVVTIIVSAAIGAGAFRLRPRYRGITTGPGLLAVGAVAQAATLLLQILILGAVGAAAVRSVGPALMVAVPLATLFVGRLLLDREERARLEAELTEKTVRLSDALNGIIDIIANMVGAHDPYTYGHQLRVAQLAAGIATKMGLSDKEIRDLELAAAVHDVGKLAIPTEILSKPGALTAEEREIVQQHVVAARRLLDSKYVDAGVAELVIQHHERCDGTGYPYGLKDAQILSGAKILAVADVVEAMSLDRPYRSGLGVDTALAEIRRGAGTLYDPDVAKACVALFEEEGFTFLAEGENLGFILPI